MVVNCVNGGAVDISRLELVVDEESVLTLKPYFLLLGYSTDWFSRSLIRGYEDLDAALAERSRLQKLLDAEKHKRLDERLAAKGGSDGQ